ncbi:uncharacterized protein LOC118190180 [Stegodyphus dumicola]|uniref:uncharacterized protein LOC118190180 n=1 Tax=Stegodyphus dumicola TaxID=202533 RepID=UPI0015AAA168|nr:uncharacterized protein LOC118190180 [Stegodyphus dumicola]
MNTEIISILPANSSCDSFSPDSLCDLPSLQVSKKFVPKEKRVQSRSGNINRKQNEISEEKGKILKAILDKGNYELKISAKNVSAIVSPLNESSQKKKFCIGNANKNKDIYPRPSWKFSTHTRPASKSPQRISRKDGITKSQNTQTRVNHESRRTTREIPKKQITEIEVFMPIVDAERDTLILPKYHRPIRKTYFIDVHEVQHNEKYPWHAESNGAHKTTNQNKFIFPVKWTKHTRGKKYQNLLKLPEKQFISSNEECNSLHNFVSFPGKSSLQNLTERINKSTVVKLRKKNIPSAESLEKAQNSTRSDNSQFKDISEGKKSFRDIKLKHLKSNSKRFNIKEKQSTLKAPIPFDVSKKDICKLVVENSRNLQESDYESNVPASKQADLCKQKRGFDEPCNKMYSNASPRHKIEKVNIFYPYIKPREKRSKSYKELYAEEMAYKEQTFRRSNSYSFRCKQLENQCDAKDWRKAPRLRKDRTNLKNNHQKDDSSDNSTEIWIDRNKYLQMRQRKNSNKDIASASQHVRSNSSKSSNHPVPLRKRPQTKLKPVNRSGQV